MSTEADVKEILTMMNALNPEKVCFGVLRGSQSSAFYGNACGLSKHSLYALDPSLGAMNITGDNLLQKMEAEVIAVSSLGPK